MGKKNCYWFIPKINYEFPVSRDMFVKVKVSTLLISKKKNMIKKEATPYRKQSKHDKQVVVVST